MTTTTTTAAGSAEPSVGQSDGPGRDATGPSRLTGFPVPAGDETPAPSVPRPFGIDEIAATPVLQWMVGVSLVGHVLTFFDWAKTRALSVEAVAANVHTCWPHFQRCGDLAFLHSLPQGHSQAAFYAVLFAISIGCVLAMAARRWGLAWLLLLTLFVWKVLVLFVLSMSYLGNYHYFHSGLTFLLLFPRHKLWFLRRGLVTLYVLSAAVKLHEGWVLGTYFSALVTGLPFVPDALIPFATNGVILLEMVVAPLLLSPRPRVRAGAVLALLGFHFYSMLFVNWLYPAMCIPPLLVLFGPAHRLAIRAPFVRGTAAGWITLAGFVAFQAVPIAIPGDEKLTLEGHGFGLYMFEANHQCISRVHLMRGDAIVADLTSVSEAAHDRCWPYRQWFTLRRVCEENRGKIDRIAWTLDHSINGGPFWRIVDERDACALDYRPFAHNGWIREPGDGAVPVAYPVKNFYQ